MPLPQVDFPGESQDRLISYCGTEYNYRSGFVSKQRIDAVTGEMLCVWRRFDYAAGKLISDEEAKLLEVEAEVPIVTDQFWALAATDQKVEHIAATCFQAACLGAALKPLQEAKSALVRAQSVQSALPDDATDEAKAAAQSAVDQATAVVTSCQAVVDAIKAQI